MDPTTLATLLAALDQQREDAERRREAREVKRQEELAAHYTSLIQTVAQLHQPGPGSDTKELPHYCQH
ncbi:UNVERIFIED_CONTAM: hypothetical protein FKN15_019648 [Acipenser sinensis]